MSDPSIHDESTTPDNHVFVLFGATGDLAKRKILPGLFHLASVGLMPEDYRIIGTSRASSALTDDEFRDLAREAVLTFAANPPEGEVWERFAASLSFTVTAPDAPDDFARAVHAAQRAIGPTARRLFHLAVPPSATTELITLLERSGLNEESRIIFEKPFGVDLESARELNTIIKSCFDETQVFRIDHFLGKESIDNILALRFANELFEPLWRRNHVRYVQIDVPETLSIEGRGAFYEDTGAFRDMVVTHLFEVLGQLAMEQPTSLTAKPLRDEVSKVFETMRPLDPREVVRGQYEGYRDEDGVAKDSTTETFIALRAWVDNARWMGVPFYLRTGKRMAQSRQIITLGLREPVMEIFPELKANPNRDTNKLIIDFKDPGSIHAEFLAKQPGPEMVLGTARMHFHYRESFQISNNLEAYERLLLEVMLGNQALFTRSDGIERLWEVSAPVLENPPPIEFYPQGTWGPYSIERVIAPHRWTLPQ